MVMAPASQEYLAPQEYSTSMGPLCTHVWAASWRMDKTRLSTGSEAAPVKLSHSNSPLLRGGSIDGRTQVKSPLQEW